ncbi:MAG: archaetidylserine decarboxylase [Gammaproteobacteria bacterium]|nr:archaetidylserine decarboxylase [Gammaproteobacteria bacterium]
MLDMLFVLSQHLAPQHTLSRLAGKLADCEVPAIKDPFIRWFAKRYEVNLDEAVHARPEDYRSFNDFFTRALKDGARPLDGDEQVLASPVDGAISQLGRIELGRCFQAKGQSFSLTELLGGDTQRAAPFNDGEFATIYLSPRDYHRIHMPITGTLREMIYIPGRLFSVNPVTTEQVPELFARNERVVAIFDTAWGPMAMVLVGAMIVASIETVWSGIVAPVRRQISVQRYDRSAPVELARGAEMGRFRLGSTVVMLMPKGSLAWRDTAVAGAPVRLGQALADRTN